MKYHLNLNIFIIAIYFISLAFEKWLSFPFLCYFFGIFIFFLPGLNLSLALEQLTAPLERAKVALWTFVFSLIITPFFIFNFPLNKNLIAQEKETLFSFFILTLLTLAIFLLTFLFKKNPVTKIKFPSFSSHYSFWIASLFLIFISLLHFMTYETVPEADSERYILAVEKTVFSGQLSNFDNRSSFYAFAWTIHHLSKISVYQIFRTVLPFFGIFAVIAGYFLSKKSSVPKKILMVSSLSLFLFPVILEEMLNVRPQLLFLFSLPISIILSTDALEKRSLGKCILMSIIFFLGIKFHQLFVFLSIGALFSTFYLLFKKSRQIFWSSLFLVLILIFFAIEKNFFGIWSYLIHLSQGISGQNFNLWFLDGYTTNYGQKLSYPGWSFIYYYLNNFGLVFPILLILAVWKNINFSPILKEYWAAILLLTIFIFFAEILPRFGINYEPKRFMLFSSATASVFVPVIIGRLYDKIRNGNIQ